MGYKTLQVVFLSISISFSAQADDSIYKVLTNSDEIKIMAYNVQNLFDAQHDEGKNDYEFLPKNHKEKENCKNTGKYKKYCLRTDWTDEKVDIKLNQVRKAIEVQGTRPDFLVLVEVENPKVITRLAEVLGYTDFVMTTSPDRRGIDNAILFKETKFNLIHFDEKNAGVGYPTRSMSVAQFKLHDRFNNDAIIGIYPVHWPSQGGGASAAKARLTIAKNVRAYAELHAAQYAKDQYHGIILGDFNTLKTEKPHPVDNVLLKSGGLKFFDVRHKAIKLKHPYIDLMPQATYYYAAKKQWNMFDRIILTGNFADGEGLEVMPETYRIHGHSRVSRENNKGEMVPYRYNHQTNKGVYYAGYSDHYPVHVKISLK